jgi:hypothetical protein
MKPVSYKRHRFLPDVIRHAVCLPFRFTLSLPDVKELLAQRGWRDPGLVFAGCRTIDQPRIPRPRS